MFPLNFGVGKNEISPLLATPRKIPSGHVLKNPLLSRLVKKIQSPVVCIQTLNDTIPL